MAEPATGRAAGGPGRIVRGLVFIGTLLAIVALALLPLLTPVFIHPALDASGSAAELGVSAKSAAALSDRSVGELIWGPGTFAFTGPDGVPFYDPAEQGHLGDARLLLWLCLVAGAISACGIGLALARVRGAARRALWGTVSAAGASAVVAVIVLGAVSLVAFATLFELFHEVFFPAGNWAFDPATQHLVQLYPFAFWQIAAAVLGILAAALGAVAWWLGRRWARDGGQRSVDREPATTGVTGGA